jgi:drug/metabolite transporter (DMT)-like permease
MIPPIALAYGAILLDEKITAASIVGLSLILAGVALASQRREVAAEEPAPPPEPA